MAESLIATMRLQNPVDMILIDYMMPTLNGLEFIEEFRKHKENVPIIMITVAADDEMLQKSLNWSKFFRSYGYVQIRH